MLKMMVFSMNTAKYFELGISELNNFLAHLIEKYQWEKYTFNPIDERLKNVLAEYTPQFYKEEWCEAFKTWLKELEVGDDLCLYDGWVSKWEEMEIIKQNYRDKFLETKQNK